MMMMIAEKDMYACVAYLHATWTFHAYCHVPFHGSRDSHHLLACPFAGTTWARREMFYIPSPSQLNQRLGHLNVHLLKPFASKCAVCKKLHLMSHVGSYIPQFVLISRSIAP